jgi:hypothetical protein
MPVAKADATAFKVTILLCCGIVLVVLTTYYALYFDDYEVRIVKKGFSL